MKLSEEIKEYILKLKKEKQDLEKVEHPMNHWRLVMDKELEIADCVLEGKIVELEYYLPKIIQLEGVK